MEKETLDAEKSFIHEHIKSRQKKKTLMRILLTVLLAVLFGGIGGIVFFVVQDKLSGKAGAGDSPTIIIARDESVPDPESESSDELISLTSTEVYNSVREGFCRITLSSPGENDWFGMSTVKQTETFGVMVAESAAAVFILTDGTWYNDGAEVYVTVGNIRTNAEVCGIDNISKLMVVKVYKSTIGANRPLVPLGNSFALNIGEPVYLFGAQYGASGAFEEGKITFYTAYEDIVDGNRQLYYTDMARYPMTAAALLNRKGEIVGWVSDYSSGDTNIAIAAGISSLKYIIEDMCVNKDTAYLGILGKTILASDVSEEAAAGFYVVEVVPESPAFAGGIQAGDRIRSINGQVINGGHALQSFLDNVEAGSTLSIAIERNGTGMVLSVVAGSR